MKDFTKWVDAWNTYNSAYDKAAEAGGGYSWTFFLHVSGVCRIICGVVL